MRFDRTTVVLATLALISIGCAQRVWGQTTVNCGNSAIGTDAPHGTTGESPARPTVTKLAVGVYRPVASGAIATPGQALSLPRDANKTTAERGFIPTAAQRAVL